MGWKARDIPDQSGKVAVVTGGNGGLGLETSRQLDGYFASNQRRFDLPIDWSLSHGFARGVLRATAGVPFGDITTYGRMARAAGSPRGARAAGNALGSNPIPIVVPCHRVLHADGTLGGYGGVTYSDRQATLAIKRRLLGLEGSWPVYGYSTD